MSCTRLQAAYFIEVVTRRSRCQLHQFALDKRLQLATGFANPGLLVSLARLGRVIIGP
jgi:hypothetical protein